MGNALTLLADLDRDNQLLLGGDNGLRGYPLRFQTGDRRFLLTLEQRFYHPRQFLRLFYAGAAVFFDAGRAWEDGVPGDGMLYDAGKPGEVITKRKIWSADIAFGRF